MKKELIFTSRCEGQLFVWFHFFADNLHKLTFSLHMLYFYASQNLQRDFAEEEKRKGKKTRKLQFSNVLRNIHKRRMQENSPPERKPRANKMPRIDRSKTKKCKNYDKKKNMVVSLFKKFGKA